MSLLMMTYYWDIVSNYVVCITLFLNTLIRLPLVMCKIGVFGGWINVVIVLAIWQKYMVIVENGIGIITRYRGYPTFARLML